MRCRQAGHTLTRCGSILCEGSQPLSFFLFFIDNQWRITILIGQWSFRLFIHWPNFPSFSSIFHSLWGDLNCKSSSHCARCWRIQVLRSWRLQDLDFSAPSIFFCVELERKSFEMLGFSQRFRWFLGLLCQADEADAEAAEGVVGWVWDNQNKGGWMVQTSTCSIYHLSIKVGIC